MRIDELNTPVTKYEYSDFASYYEPMQITKEQKEKRTETAHDLWYVFLMFFTMLIILFLTMLNNAECFYIETLHK